MLITAVRLGGLEVKTLFYQPMDPGSSPGEGKKKILFFFPKKKTLKSIDAYMRRWRALSSTT